MRPSPAVTHIRPLPTAPKEGAVCVLVGAGLGDLLLHAGHFRAIADWAGRPVLVAAKKAAEARDLLAGAPFVADVLPLARDQAHSGFVSIRTVAGRLRAAGVGTAILLHTSSRLLLALALASVPLRVGFRETPLGRLLLTHGAAVGEMSHSPMLRLRADALLGALGFALDHAGTRLPPSGAAAAAARARLEWLPRPLIALGINSSQPSKQWGGANFATLAHAILDTRPASFVLFGAGDVAPEAERIKTALGNRAPVIDLAGNSITDSHGMLAACDAYIGNDSFGLNLAAYCGVPAVGLFGATQPLPDQPLLRPVRLEPDPSAPFLGTTMGIKVPAVRSEALTLLAELGFGPVRP